jgi:hypothetical protein
MEHEGTAVSGGQPAAPPRALRRPGVWLLLLLPVHGLALALAPASAVEAFYGRFLFPLVARAHAALDGSAVSPGVTIGALLLAGVVSGGVGAARSAGPLGGLSVAVGRFARSAGWRLVVVAAALAHTFAPSWGLNYRRPSAAERLGLDTSIEPAAFTRTADRVVLATNAARLRWGQPDLRRLEADIDAAVHTTLRELGLAEAAVPGRRARLLPRGLMAIGGWSGVTLPWTTEAMVDPAIDPRCLAHALAHEKAHQAGFAREADANFIAWLALVRSDDPRLRYSTLFYVADLFTSRANAKLEPDVVADIREAVTTHQAVQVPVVQQATHKVYDTYLRANEVSAGIDDYDHVAALIHAWLKEHPETLGE